jgi:hypothetical protein
MALNKINVDIFLQSTGTCFDSSGTYWPSTLLHVGEKLNHVRESSFLEMYHLNRYMVFLVKVSVYLNVMIALNFKKHSKALKRGTPSILH